MSAAQMKRIGALEQTLSERYAPQWAALEKLRETMTETIFEGCTDEEVEAILKLTPDPPSVWVLWARGLGVLTLEDDYLSELSAWTDDTTALLMEEDFPPFPVPPLPAYDPRPGLEGIAVLEENADSGPNPEGTRFHLRAVRAHLAFLEAVAQCWPGG